MKFLFPIVTVLFLSACGGGQVNYMAQTNQSYASVPVKSVRVSARPPLGQYQVLGMIDTQQASAGETLVPILARLQEKAAEEGGNYVWLVGASENNYIAPGFSNTFSSASANGTAQGYYDRYGNWTATGYGNAAGNSFTINTPAHPYSLVEVQGKVLRVTGSLESDMSKAAFNGQFSPAPTAKALPSPLRRIVATPKAVAQPQQSTYTGD